VLVFTRTKHRAKKLDKILVDAGFQATSLQGNLSQNRRKAALDGFRSGKYSIMVATDIAARGIDISQISHVINYDIPDTPEAYIHRIGRTGRAARSGDAFTLVTAEDTIMVRTIEKKLNTELERRSVEGFDYSVPAPHKDSEFARPPRPPQGHKKPAARKTGSQGQGFSANPKSTSSAKPQPHAIKPDQPGTAPTARHPQRSQRAH
jgi:ATP-dependent RNA helicase RhlE